MEGAKGEVVPEVVTGVVEEGEVVVEEVEVGVVGEGEGVAEVDFRKATAAVIHIHTRRVFLRIAIKYKS